MVEAPGNEHILNGSSRDQVVIKRLRDCDGTVLTTPEADHLVRRGMERATADMLACRRHLRTNDPAKCVAALWVAWNRVGASTEHLNSDPMDWVHKYVPICIEALLVEETYANAHASLGTRLRGPSLMVGGPQIHWNDEAYTEQQELTRMDALATWQGQVLHRKNEARGRGVRYIFSRINHLDVSSVGVLDHFHAYDRDVCDNSNL